MPSVNDTFWIPGSLARHMGYETGSQDDSLPCITLNGTSFQERELDSYIPLPSPHSQRGMMDLYDHPRVLLDTFRRGSEDYNSYTSQSENNHKQGFNGPSSLQCQVSTSRSSKSERKNSGVVHWVSSNNGCETSSLQSFPTLSIPASPPLASPEHTLESRSRSRDESGTSTSNGFVQSKRKASKESSKAEDGVELLSMSSLDPSDEEDTLRKHVNIKLRSLLRLIFFLLKKHLEQTRQT